MPTWNYVAVHVSGSFNIVTNNERTIEIMDRTIQLYDPDLALTWQSNLDHDTMNGLLKGIVAFEIQIHNWEGKWKLSQNHSTERQEKVIHALEKSHDQNDLEIAKLMKSADPKL